MYIFICVSEIFFFVCFVVVLVGSTDDPTSLWESVFKLGEHSVHPLLVIDVVYNGLAEDPAHDLVMSRVEVESRVDALVRAKERGLQSETIN